MVDQTPPLIEAFDLLLDRARPSVRMRVSPLEGGWYQGRTVRWSQNPNRPGGL